MNLFEVACITGITRKKTMSCFRQNRKTAPKVPYFGHVNPAPSHAEQVYKQFLIRDKEFPATNPFQLHGTL